MRNTLCVERIDQETMLTMETGANIRRIRKARGLTILQLATAIGSDVGNLSRLERGVQGYSPDMLERIARALSVSVSDLFLGETNVTETQSLGRVPLISWVAAGSWCNVARAAIAADAEDWLLCPVRHSPRTYALRVRGLSMYDPTSRPSFADGDIIFVDPEVAAKHRSLVIAMRDDYNEATFKRLLVDGDEMLLEALNPSWPHRIMQTDKRMAICGVVIAKMESFI